MKKILRSVSLLLAFVFAVSLLAACDTVEQARESESAGSGGAAVVSIGPAVSEAAEGGFPDIYRDWCGMTVDILAASCGGHSLYEYGVSGLKDESHADAISTAFRQRAERIEREYGLVAEVTLTEGIGEAADTILQQHLAGLDDYQLVADGLFFLLQPNMAGVLQDFYEIGEGCLDLGADYWD